MLIVFSPRTKKTVTQYSLEIIFSPQNRETGTQYSTSDLFEIFSQTSFSLSIYRADRLFLLSFGFSYLFSKVGENSLRWNKFAVGEDSEELQGG